MRLSDLKSIVLISFLFVSHAAEARKSASACLLHALQGLLEKRTTEFGDMLPQSNTVYQFEAELARQSGLGEAEVVGIVRNFSDDFITDGSKLVTDGSLGIYRTQTGAVIDVNSNLLKAYKTGMQAITPGRIAPEQLIRLREESIEKLVTNRNGQVTRLQPRMRPEGRTVYVVAEIHPEVRQKLQAYGYLVEATGGKTRITYPSNQEISRHLDDFTSRLNEMIRQRYPPEVISSYAVQELLIIHPFANGNGRVARLLGQILYKKLTGKTIIFPREFHQELQYPLEALTQKLFQFKDEARFAAEPSLRGHTIMADGKQSNLLESDRRSYRKLASDQDFVEAIYRNEHLTPEVPRTGAAHPNVQDTPFGDFYVAGRRFHFDDLPDYVKAGSLEGMVFYGTPAESLADAEKKAGLLFQYGRSSRGTPSRDLGKYLEAAGGGSKGGKEVSNSGFFPTSRHYESALPYMHWKNTEYGIQFVIDPKGVEGLNIVQLRNYLAGRNIVLPAFGGEGEFTLSGSVNPRRIVGAVVYKLGRNGPRTQTPVKFLVNPNYVPGSELRIRQ